MASDDAVKPPTPYSSASGHSRSFKSGFWLLCVLFWATCTSLLNDHCKCVCVCACVFSCICGACKEDVPFISIPTSPPMVPTCPSPSNSFQSRSVRGLHSSGKVYQVSSSLYCHSLIFKSIWKNLLLYRVKEKKWEAVLKMSKIEILYIYWKKGLSTAACMSWFGNTITKTQPKK